MNQSIATLTATLQKALDSNYDVIDMGTVLFVISQLENATITKEQLETTRLAKYINQLRRRTCSEPLARRAKNLIKKWREIFIPQQQSNSSISAAGTSGTGHTQQQQQQQQSQHQLRSTAHLQNTHDSVTAHGNYLSKSPEIPSSNMLLTTGVGCEDIDSSSTSYSQQYQQRYYQQQQQQQQLQQQKTQQNSSSAYDFHYNSRQLAKQHDLSLPDYPSSNYNRKLNTGSANKRNQAINDSGGDGAGDIGTGSSSTLPQQMHRRSHTTHSQSFDPHERSSKYIKETSLPEHPKNNYNRKSNNTRSANQMEQKYQQQQQQQQHQQKHLISNGGGSNLSIDDRLMTGNTRTRMKSLKFEKTDTTKDSNSNKSKRNSNKSQPISFANLLPASTDNSNLEGSVVTHPSFIIEDRSHSPLASLSSSCKSKLSHSVERRSPVLVENSVSPLDFEHNSNQSRDNSIIVNMKNESDSAAMYCSIKLPMINGENRLGSMVELNDYNSNSNLMMNTLDSSIQPSSPLINLYNNATNCNPDDNETSTEHRKSKKHKKDKKKHKQQQSQKISNSPTEHRALATTTTNNQIPSDYMNMEENYQLSKHPQHHQENMFPPNDSLSNSSLSIFPSTNINTITSTNINQDNIDGIDDRELNINVNNQKSDLSFAGKFKNSSSHSTTENISQHSQNFSVMNSSIPNAQSNINSVQFKLKKPQKKENDSVVVIESRSCSPFTPIAASATTVATNSIDSSTSSCHHNDVIDLMVAKANKEIQGGVIDNITTSKQKIITPTLASTRERRGRHAKTAKQEVPAVTQTQQLKSTLIGSGNHNSASIAGDGGSEHNQQIPTVNADPAVKTPKKRGRKKRLKTSELPPSNPGNFLNSQLFENSRLLSISTLTTNKKVKTTKELLADIQNRKLESAASSPTLIHSQFSRVPSPCSDIIDSASDSNTTPGINTINSQKSVKHSSSQTKKDNSSTKTDNDFCTTVPSTTLEKQQNSSLKQLKTVDDEIEVLMKLLPPVDRSKIQWNNNDDDKVMCSCYVRTSGDNQENNEQQIKVDFSKDEEHLSVLTATSPMVVLSPGNATLAPIISASPAIKSLKSLSDENSISILLSSSKQQFKTPLTSPCSKSCSSASEKMISSRKPPIKSIFDLDYDEDDDPLNSIVEAANNPSREITLWTKPKDDYENDDGDGYDDVKMNKMSNKCIEYTAEYNNEANDDDIYNMIKIKKKAKKISKQNASKSDIIDNSTTSSSQQSLTAAMLQSLEQQQQQFSNLANTKSSVVAQTSQFPLYEAIEDVNCPAKNLYVTQRNKITLYHINSLHNRFIPNVNGNWDNSGIITTKTTTTATSDFMIITDEISGSRLVKINCDDDEMNSDGLYKRVVPQYNHIIMDRIPKDLSHIEFTKNYKIKKFNKHMNNNKKIKNNRLQYNTSSSELTLFKGADANINQNRIEEIDDNDNNDSNDNESNADENDLILHKHIKRQRLSLKEKDDKLMLKNYIKDLMDENKKDVSMLTINLDDDDDDDNDNVNVFVENNTFNINKETSNINNFNDTKNNSNENIEKNDVIMLDEDDNNRDNNNDHIMKDTENVLTIKLDTDDDDDEDDDDFDVVVNNEESITNKLLAINDDNDKIITVKMITDQKEGEEEKQHENQDDYEDDDEEEQIKGQKINNNKDFLKDKSVSRRQRSSSCSSSSSNHNDSNNFNNHNINLNNNDNDNISDNNRNFINNINENNDDDEDEINDNLNNIPCSAVIDKSNNSNVNNNNDNNNKNNNNNCLNEGNYVDDNNSMENDSHQQQLLLSRNSMLSNYLEEEKYHDDDDDDEYIGKDNNYDDDDDDDDRDFNDEGDGGGDASNSSDFHHQIVTHDMTSSTSTTSQKHIVLTIKKTPVDNTSRHQQQSQEQQHQQLQPQQISEQQNKDDDFLMLSMLSPGNIFSSPSISVTPNNTVNSNNSISNITSNINANNDLGSTTKDKCKGNVDNGNNFDVISENNSIEKSLLNNNDDDNFDKTTVTSEVNTILINDVCSGMKMNEENDLMISNDKSYDMAVSSVNAVVAYNDYNDNNEGDNKDVIDNYDDNHTTSSIMNNNSKKINELKRKYHDANDDYNTTEDFKDYKMMNIDSINYDDDDDDNNKDKNNSEYNSVSRYYHYNRNNNNNDIDERNHHNDNDCYDNDEYNTDSLPIENNGFLKSFNNLTEENRTGIRKIIKQEQKSPTTSAINSKTEKKLERALTNDNGNNNNNSSSNRSCNSSNSNINNNINNNTSNIINLVDNNQDENKQEEQQFQQFKEWYEVHQVRSYNDELLTILPYVVID